jgi:UDP-glucose 4-epimerase
MKSNNVKHIVFSSTAAVYDLPIDIPISEEHPLQPINPYGISKLMIELMLMVLGIFHYDTLIQREQFQKEKPVKNMRLNRI